MQKLPNLIWLRSFEAAAQHLSFTQAAAELGLTQTAVSLHVRSLEAELGCALFTRAARRLTLTQAGQAYAYSLRQSLGDIAFSTASLFGTAADQMLTVRVPMSTAGLWLAHRLPEFSQLHPDKTIRMISQVWNTGTSATEPVDVELRFGSGNWPGVQARKISTEQIVPICAAGSEQDLSAWQTGPLVQILGFEDMQLRYLTACGLTAKAGATRYAVDTTVAAIDIVATGGGVAVVLERFARTAIATGKPIAIAGDAVPTDLAHYIVTPSTPYPNDPAVFAFEVWLETALQSKS